ncbi:MAG TPA: sulfotransferase [Acetobacteraceae bacterium]|nr:sulfotransferase [Acetobacteraceae bacterium]
MAEGLQVFILGAARSGTSITYYAMREIFGLPGPGESHVMPVFQRVIHEFWLYRKTFVDASSNDLAVKLSPAEFRRHTHEFVRMFYHKQFPERRWVDKTPGAEAVVGASLVQESFPEARIIFTKRTGIEVVESYRKKFSAGFSDACDAWAGAMESLLRIREQIRNGILVDQYDLTNAPRETAARIASHLGHPERSGDLAEFFSRRRTDQKSAHDWSRRLTLADVDWSEEERDIFTRVCGQAMRQFEYPM